ncbi:MAG: hypothetical protein CL450_04315 [Acidimicrobiaceae bacterium]|nr:hypothetical protein [Acidimicrobiaceae bacterium]|tara:strand:+ start:207 stop:776 length:570 start_codon:yes stop_codon:yes gene_type:complete
MTTHAAIRDSIVEMTRRVGRPNLDVPEMKTLMEFVERSQPGDEFTNQVRSILSPVQQHIQTRDITKIQEAYPDFPLTTITDKLAEQEKNAIWQALAMTNMLLTTLTMVPMEMMTKIESMTSTMMGMMSGGSASPNLNELFGMMHGIAGGGDENTDEDDDEPVPRPKPSKKLTKKSATGDKQSEFRRKLC